MSPEKSDKLRDYLKKIASNESDVQSVAAELDAELGRDCTVMVSYFSSFLGLARESGIVGALASIEMAHQIAAPILETLGGQVLRADPDNLVVVFSKPIDAVMAARAVSRAFEEQNTSGGNSLSICLGIGQGRLLVTEEQAYGEQAILASRLGNAIEGSFEIYLTPEAYEGVKHLESLTFSQADPIMIAGEKVTPYKIEFV